MVKLTKSQLEDFMVTVWEGGSNYWLDLHPETKSVIRKHKVYPSGSSFAEIMAEYLCDGLSIQIVDSEDLSETLGEVSLDKINKAFNHPEMKRHADDFLNEQGDAETTDCLIQWAIFNEIIYC
jgi:hypothetical protein